MRKISVVLATKGTKVTKVNPPFVTFVPFVANSLLLRIRIRQLLVVLLDQLLVSLRNFVFLRRSNVFLRQQKLQAAAQLQLDAAQRIQNLLRHFLDSLGIAAASGIISETLEGTGNLIELS